MVKKSITRAQQLSKKKISTRTFIFSVGFTLIIAILVTWLGIVTIIANDAYRYRDLDTTRQLILTAAKSTKIPVPADAKTGDFYFSQERLMLPANTKEDMRLTYGYYPSLKHDTGDYDLTVSSDFALLAGESKVLSAQTQDQLYKAVPLLQACVRGVRVVENPTDQLKNDNALELKETVNVGEGRTVYLYSEKACPWLETTVYHLKTLRAY